MRWSLRVFFVLLLLLGLVVAYLNVVGFPAYVTNRVLDRLAQEGFFLQMERLTLELDRGFVAKGARLFPTPYATDALLEADAIGLAANPIRLLAGRPAIPVLTVENGLLRITPGNPVLTARTGIRELVMENIHLQVSFVDNELRLRSFHARFLDILWDGRGFVQLPAPKPDEEPSAPAAVVASNQPARPVLDLLAEVMEQLPEAALNAAERLNRITFPSPPTARFSFGVYMDDPAAGFAAIRLHSPDGIHSEENTFDQLVIEAQWREGRIQISDIQVQKDHGILSLSGWYDITAKTVFLNLQNTLPPDVFLQLCPPAIQRQAAAFSDDFNFPVHLTVQLGPSSTETLDAMLGELTVRLDISDADIRGVPVEHLRVNLRKDGDIIHIGDSFMQLSEGAEASRVAVGSGWFNLGSKRFEATAQGAFNPHHIKPVLTTNMQNIVDWFTITEPVSGSVTIGGTAGNPAIYCYGPIQATNVAINEVPVPSVKGDLNITNEVMHLTRVIGIRPEGMVRGEMHMAFSNQTLRLEVDGTLNPRDVAKMIGPAVEDFMEPFQLNGPATVQLSGLLDYCTFALNDLQGHAKAYGFGYDRWEADTAEFDLTVRGRHLAFSNVAMTVYGGQVTGAGTLYPVMRDNRWRYEVDYAAEGIQLKDLLEQSMQTTVEKLHGLVDSQGTVGGYIGLGTGPEVTGSGYAEVQKGLLFETKLFTGLTFLLTRILPDFNWFAQTDAAGHFTIHNSRVYSQDIALGGSIFSVKSRGSYGFDGDLNFRVEVQLLRSGPVAKLIRLATFPVTRLLEFRLTGTFADPTWRPVNLNPADLFN